MGLALDRFPAEFREDLEHAVLILQEFGAKQVFVFGSLVEPDNNTPPRDIDLAVSGLPKDRFFASTREKG